MKFALVNKIKTEATPGSKGLCQICDSELVAKCGEIRVHHWSHKSKRDCDPWWENESEWHRAWKNEFPIDWQEIVHHDENGERHIRHYDRQGKLDREILMTPGKKHLLSQEVKLTSHGLAGYTLHLNLLEVEPVSDYESLFAPPVF